MKKYIKKSDVEVFQGVKYLNTKKDYFEGWYFKNNVDNYNIAFIPGISFSENKSRVFIQVITNKNSFVIDYDLNDFEFSLEPFFIKIKDNYFSKERIILNIDGDITIKGILNYSNSVEIKKSKMNPNIMGPFSYIPFMECNHAILAMENHIDGSLYVNREIIDFSGGKGYIEKDWGTSFPNKYIWCQGNNFENNNVSFMLSVANIPFKVFSFKGLICVLVVDGIEYRFATYNGARIKSVEKDNNKIIIVLKKKSYTLEIELLNSEGFNLLAPVAGKMEKDIVETINGIIHLTLKEEDEIIFDETSLNAGVEVVLE